MAGMVVTTEACGRPGLRMWGSRVMLRVGARLDALLGLAIGLFVSSFAKTEFQAVQFLPAVLLPQLLLCGLLTPRESMPTLLRVISNFLPLTYAIDATNKVMQGHGSMVNDLLLIGLFLVLLLAAGAVTLRRKTK